MPQNILSFNDSLMFFTAPDDDIPLYGVDTSYLQLSSPVSSSVASLGTDQSTDDTFPTTHNSVPDLPIVDESFTALEKIYVFSRSKSVFHRLFIVHAMPSFLNQVTPADAIEFVLPLLYVLARDQGESVRETLAGDLNPIIWWFFTNCQLTADDIVDSDQPTPIALISVQAFTHILCILLLSSNSTVCRGARNAVVNLLLRMRRADIREGLVSPEHLTDREMDESAREQNEQDIRNGVGLFGSAERRLFEHEVLHRLVIGLGHLNEEDFSAQNDEEDMGGYEDPNENRTEDDQDASTRPLSSSLLTHEETIDFRESDTEKAAIGRLSSMSLIAGVTASGSLDDDAKASFVCQVEHVAHDQAWFVRNEAAFALGALARVVPEEVVLSSLLPIFEGLRGDAVWNVRQSAMFALPAILRRLSPSQRRYLALETVLSLAADESTAVRIGVLEALGEVIYAFHRDPGGPPNELVRIFLGQDVNPIPLNYPESSSTRERGVAVIRSVPVQLGAWDDVRLQASISLSSPANENPSRALICAFNFPAVVFTVGRARWDELRGMYLELAAHPDMMVHRTLAASLGELAQIIGAENTRRDLVGVWKAVVRSRDTEVRVRAIGCVELFVSALRGKPDLDAGHGKNMALEVVKELQSAWAEDCFWGWREREDIAKILGKLAELVGQEHPAVFRSLLKMALEDRAAAVRESAVSAIHRLWELFADRQDVLDDLQRDIESLAQSNSYRGRMTFIACQYPLISPDNRGRSIVIPNDDFWRTIRPLADDKTVDVRISVARLVGTHCDTFLRQSQPVKGVLLDLVQHLSLDSAPDVRLYVPELFEGGQGHPYSAVLSGRREDFPASSPISRPPPLSVAATSDGKHSIAVTPPATRMEPEL